MFSSLSAQSWNHILPDYSIVEIIPYDGGYWLATESSGALRFDSQDNEWYFYNQSNGFMPQNDDINDMKIMDGKVWFATNYGLYTCTLEGTNWDHDLLPGDVYSNWVRAFDANSDTAFIASFTGLVTYSFQTHSYTAHDNLVPGNYQTSYTNSIFATDTVVWIGTDDGIIRYDTSLPISNTASRTYYDKNNAFITNSDIVMCNAICATDNGVWVGLSEYTPASNPNYCIGGLFHQQGGMWEKFDQSTGLPADGIHFIQEYGDKIYAGLFNYVDGVNYDGAGLFVLNTHDSTWKVLDRVNWHIETDAVRSFYCTSTDTLVGTEEGIYTNLAALPGLKPYARPAWFSLRSIGNGDIEVRVDSVYRAKIYELYISLDGVNFDDTLYIDAKCDTITTLSDKMTYYIKIAGKNDYGTGPVCKDVLGVSVSDIQNDILLIQGFDLNTVGNTYDYCKDHGRAIVSAGHGFDAVSDEAIVTANIDLSSYKMIDWITGMDKNVFTANEKDAIRSYLEGGGKLFISGSQIVDNVYVVDRDADFYADYLKARWVTRDCPCYTAQPTMEGVFNGIDSVAFDNGSHGIYDVFAADGFRPTGGAESCMLYSKKDSALFGSAALQYTGTFASSENQAQLIYMGFPFESIYSDSMKNALMLCVLNYFEYDVVLTFNMNINIPQTSTLEQNYPNPFNPITVIDFQVSLSCDVDLSIFDMNGKKVANLIHERKSAGDYSVNWDASHQSSGIYFYRFQAGEFYETKKMLLVK